MSQEVIITIPAVEPGSGLGTPLNESFKMCNDNFTEIYATNIMDGGVNVTDVKVGATSSTAVGLTRITLPSTPYEAGTAYDVIAAKGSAGIGMMATVADELGNGAQIVKDGTGYVSGDRVQVREESGAFYTYSTGGESGGYLMSITNGIITKFDAVRPSDGSDSSGGSDVSDGEVIDNGSKGDSDGEVIDNGVGDVVKGDGGAVLADDSSKQ